MAAVLACRQAGRVNVGFAPESVENLGVTMSILEYWGAALSHRPAAALWELLPPRTARWKYRFAAMAAGQGVPASAYIALGCSGLHL